MDPKRWTIAVALETEEQGKLRVICSTAEAAEFMLNHWPVERGPLYIEAQKACLAVLGGEQPPEFAREAFVAAADEAGILGKV